MHSKNLFLRSAERRATNLGRCFLAILIVALLAGTSACGQAAVPATPTPASTSTPVPTPTPAPTIQPGETERNLTVNGQQRTYLLHIPPALDKSSPAPLVFAFSGYDIEIHFEISDMKMSTGFGDLADKNGFILVYPYGVSGTWNVNADNCCGDAADNKVDETAFVHQIISDVGTIASVDPKRIYAVGFNLGAILTFSFACEMSDTFAAVAPVSGALLFSPCQPQQPVSVIQVHGKNDTLIPYEGGKGNLFSGELEFPPVEQDISTWAQLDKCTGPTQTENLGTTVTHTIYASCASGTAVELYSLEGLGNNWVTKYVLPVSQIIWDFFKAHPKQ